MTDTEALNALCDGKAVLTMAGREVSLANISYESLEGEGVLAVEGEKFPVYVTPGGPVASILARDKSFHCPPKTRNLWIKFLTKE